MPRSPGAAKPPNPRAAIQAVVVQMANAECDFVKRQHREALDLERLLAYSVGDDRHMRQAGAGGRPLAFTPDEAVGRRGSRPR